jgi:hypothetical protein
MDGDGQQWRKNGVNTAVKCTISSGPAVACSDTTHSVAFVTGDLISIGTTQTGSTTPKGTRWTAEYTP